MLASCQDMLWTSLLLKAVTCVFDKSSAFYTKLIQKLGTIKSAYHSFAKEGGTFTEGVQEVTLGVRFNILFYTSSPRWLHV